MKKFYALFIAVLVAVTAFAQSPKARRAMAMPTRLTTLSLPKARTLTTHSLPVSTKKHVARPKAKLARRAPELAPSYVRVNTTPENWEGEYLIVYEGEDGALAMNGGLADKLDVAGNTVAVTVDDQEIASTSDTEAIAFTIAAVEGGYSIKSRSGLYMGWNAADKNGLDSSSETAFVNKLSINGDGEADIVSESGSYLRFNAAENQKRFRYFKSMTYQNQQPVALYKKGGEKTEIEKPELVVLPEGLETEDYTLEATVYTSEGTDRLNETVQVAFDGNTIYAQGLSYWFEEAWAKGTIVGDKVLFASNQYMGQDEYGPDFLIGFVDIDEENFEAIEYIIFDYDPATRVLTLNENNWIGESDEMNSTEIWSMCNEMTLTPGEAVEPVTPGTVQLPDGLTAEPYVFTSVEVIWDDEGMDLGDAEELPAAVAFDGDDVYIQGLCSYLPEAWVKGTKSGNTVLVPAGQFFGTVYGVYDLYFVGYDEATDDVCDVTFTIGEDGVMSSQNYFFINAAADGTEYYKAFVNLVLTPGEIEEPEAVELPEELTPEAYVIVAQDLSYDDDDNEVYETVSTPGQIAFDKENGECYIQGLSTWLPEAWVKGTYNDGEIVIPTGQYLGDIETWIGNYPIYFVGTDDEFAEPCDVHFSIANDGKLLTTRQWVISGGDKTLDGAYTLWRSTTFMKPDDKAAVPAAPVVTDFADWDEEDEYGLVEINVPLLDEAGEAMVADKLSYKLFVDEGGQISEFKFTADLYEALDKDMTEIPFLFDDDWDFDRNGTTVLIAFYLPSQDYTRVGVQSIYRGGNAENKSEISWFTIDRGGEYDAVKGITAGSQDKTAIYNLAGQRVQKPTKGLYIQNGKKMLVK